MVLKWYSLWIVLSTVQSVLQWKLGQLALGPEKPRFEDQCDNVCADLPKNDAQPVCMMFSRYKKGYQFFINQCHARRAICKENIVLHMVHTRRCLWSNQYFMPVN